MTDQEQLARTATLLADGTRAEMLVAMMDGRAFPAGQLAALSHVSASTASHHLSCLIEGGLVEVFQCGRHRYHRLAAPQVAELIEALGGVGPSPAIPLHGPAAKLAKCRTCYDHLAGRMAVELCGRFLQEEFLIVEDDGFLVTPSGLRFFEGFGVSIKASRRPAAKRCLDWTERRPHVGGALGAAFLNRLFELGWVKRGESPRSIEVSVVGAERMFDLFGLAA
jgi:DNA-binding transcriptional ArsR family regulator